MAFHTQLQRRSFFLCRVIRITGSHIQRRPDKLGFGFWGLRFFVIILAKPHMEDEAIGRVISH